MRKALDHGVVRDQKDADSGDMSIYFMATSAYSTVPHVCAVWACGRVPWCRRSGAGLGTAAWGCRSSSSSAQSTWTYATSTPRSQARARGHGRYVHDTGAFAGSEGGQGLSTRAHPSCIYTHMSRIAGSGWLACTATAYSYG